MLTAIRADHLITERQRQVLIDIYESFRKENHQAEAPDDEAQTSQKAPLAPEPRRGEAGPSPDGEVPLPGNTSPR